MEHITFFAENISGSIIPFPNPGPHPIKFMQTLETGFMNRLRAAFL